MVPQGHKLRRGSWLALLVVAMVAALTLPGQARGDNQDAVQTLEAAVRLLRNSMQVSMDGRHNLMLRALRQMGDPQMEPLFAELAQSPQASLKIHGLLGLAEVNKDKKLDLVRLAAIDSPALQAEIISAAMDGQMLSNAQAAELMNWPGLDPGVKVLVAAQLVHAKQPVSMEAIKDAGKSENLARKGLAALLLLQAGDAGAMAVLQALDKATEATRRDQAREMMLTTALRYEFDKVAPWATAMSTEAGINPRLGLMALRTAMRFNAAGATETWRQQYDSTSDAAQRTRLALAALHNSSWSDAKFFDPLIASEDSLIKQIGVTGAAVAQKNGVGPAAVALVEMMHPLSTNWALDYARDHAPSADSSAIFLAVIKSAAAGPSRNRPQRMEDALNAAQLLAERDPEAALRLLRPLLMDTKTDSSLPPLVLIGLMRCNKGNPLKIIEGIERFEAPAANDAALVLRAKHGQSLSPQQLQDLSLIVRGAGPSPMSLKLQAAWLYLRLTNQTKTAINQVLGKA